MAATFLNDDYVSYDDLYEFRTYVLTQTQLDLKFISFIHHAKLSMFDKDMHMRQFFFLVRWY